jgi:hypothetical protein
MTAIRDLVDGTFVNLTPHSLYVDSSQAGPNVREMYARGIEKSEWTLRCSQTPDHQLGACGAAKVMAAPRFGPPILLNNGPLDKPFTRPNELSLSTYGKHDNAFFTLLHENVKNGGKMAVLVSMPVGDWFRRFLTVRPGEVLPFGWLEPWAHVAILGPNTAPRKKDEHGNSIGEGAIRDASGQIMGTTGFVAYHLPNAV